jgi:plasmid maintenance system antidote protein VapI
MDVEHDLKEKQSRKPRLVRQNDSNLGTQLLSIATGQIQEQELRWRETMSDETYYTVLGISDTATQDEIDRAYQNLIEAYHVLSDSTERSSYDQQLAERRRQSPAAPTEMPKAAPSSCLSRYVLSKRIGFSADEAKDLLAGRLPINPTLARTLQSELGSSVEFWMSQPFEEDAINPFAVMAIVVFFTGLGYAVFLLAHVL